MRPQDVVSVFRRLAPASMLLFALSAATGPAAGQPAQAPIEPVALSELAAASPEGFDLQEVTVSPGEEPGAVEVVTATYLGAGVRNAISYTRFADAEAAKDFLAGVAADSCSVRSTSTCVDRVREIIVSGTSSTTCPHATPDVKRRARTLLEFGSGQAAKSVGS